MKIPKRVDVIRLRQIMGDKAAEVLLMKMYAPLLGSVKVTREQYQNTLAVLEDSAESGRIAGQVFPPVFRQYFGENPQGRGKFKAWLGNKIEATAPAEPEKRKVTTKKRKRRAA